MGKERDSSNHAHEAHSYPDVAGDSWSNCWTHHGSGVVPVRAIIMGSSAKLGHAETTSEEFKVTMLEKFGFSEKDDVIIEFFEDSFENISGAAGNLMKSMIAVKNLVGRRHASQDVISVRLHTPRSLKKWSSSGQYFTVG